MFPGTFDVFTGKFLSKVNYPFIRLLLTEGALDGFEDYGGHLKFKTM